jgi:hypothetical protein
LFLGYFGAGKAFTSDEVWSIRAVAQPFAGMLETLRADVHPPLYYLLLAAWRPLAGDGEIALRTLSIALYLAAGLAIAWFSRRLFGGSSWPTAAALLLASPLALVAAQYVRMYSLLLLAGTFSTGAWLLLNRRTGGERRMWLLYIAANACGVFTHVWFFFQLLGQGVAQLVLYPPLRLWRFAAAVAVSLAPLGVLWLPVLVDQVGRTSQALAWVPEPGVGLLGEALLLQAGLACLLAPLPLWLAWRRKPWREVAPGRRLSHPVSAATLVFAVALLAPFLLSYWKPVFSARFTVVALPALALAGAGAVSSCCGPAFARLLLGAAVIVSLGANLTSNACDSRNAARFLARHAGPGDLVVFTNLSRLPVEHYLNRLSPQRPWQATSFPAAIDQHPGYAGQLEPQPLKAEAARLVAGLREQGARRVILLDGFRPAADAPLREVLAADYSVDPELTVHCPSMGCYLNTISVFQRP